MPGTWRLVEKVALGLIILLGVVAVASALQQIHPASPGAIYFVPGRPFRIALTFETRSSDDGLAGLLKILKAEGVSATFFLTGNWLKKYPAEAASILGQGHEIGNHTLNHSVLLYLSGKEIKEELNGFNEAAREILEYRPVSFRPPRGLYNGLVLEAARKQHCRTVLWSVESYDYLSGDPAELCARIKSRVHHGAIVVFRVGAPVLLDALPEILACLREQGYLPVTVSALLKNGTGEHSLTR